MTTDPHAEFLQDPEAHAAHLATCSECRALVQALDAPVSGQSIRMEKLPLAAWEGATYRSWPFVAAASAVVAVMAIVLCHMADVSPLHLMALDASINTWRAVFSSLTGVLQRAPIGVQILFGIAFVFVNTILFVLLRRPTRGIDA
jgi:hypothetical protein